MPCPIVAIAASAGGLEALIELLGAVPPNSGLAFLVVQHLDPGHASLLPEILEKKTPLAVTSAQDGEAIRPDHVYVIPPNATLTVTATRLRVVPRGAGLHRPADILFASLAEERAELAIGVVLSGSDADGALGTQAIKHAGGITFAQDPESARFPSMPRHAIQTGCVDFVLGAPQIAHELVRLSHHPYLRAEAFIVAAPEGSERNSNESEEESFARVFRRLRSTHGVDFAHYKRSTLRRRLERRMALQRADSLVGYVDRIEADTVEANALFQDFLIRVTTFFRDPESFESLANQVFPRICVARSAKSPVRIWVPGCASGEEVYSIAMMLMEYLSDQITPEGIQIFGTDASETAIEKARVGLYPESIEQEVSNERLRRFFVRHGDHFRIDKKIRDACIFARHDVTRDPPFSRLDLVSCRNLLIYLDPPVQRRVMQIFHYALRPDGFLLLGPSETVGQASNLFDLLDKQHRIYTRVSTAAGIGIELSAHSSQLSGISAEADGRERGVAAEIGLLQRDADRFLLSRFAPAALLIDETLNVIQYRGETGPYLEHATGAPSISLHRILRPELLVEVAPAIQEAREQGTEVRKDGLILDARSDVGVAVIPLRHLSSDRGYLIVFDGAVRQRGGRHERLHYQNLSESEKDRRLIQLEREIAAGRDYLQATLEEYDAVREELKSAHEEVLSANEEFQSTNEELETAKEELQSANEELTTTNDELRNRNRELGVVNSELQSFRSTAEYARDFADTIVETVLEPLLVLDGKLTIVRANTAFYADFNTAAAQTESRPLYELGNQQWNVPALRMGLAAVLIGNEPLVDFEVEKSFPDIGERMMRLNARKIPSHAGRPELILLAISDVTARQARSDLLAQEARRKDDFLAMLAHELRNPLAPIKHAVQLLRRAADDGSAPKLYDMIERQTRRLVRLVDELLDVARITRGLIELQLEPVDIGALIQLAAAANRSRAEERKQTLTITLPEAPVWVSGDPVRLEQVISNLIDNSSKYSAGGGSIALTLTQHEGEAVLSVRDNGLGLAPETLESIFDLFSQVDRSLAHSGGGLGIGLTLVRRIVELHGGRIEARSEGLGHGSELIVRLPAQSFREISQHPVHLIEADLTGIAAHPHRVLIVEDNRDGAEALALLLASLGHETAVAHDAEAALGVADAFNPDLALVDIGLPGMSGYEFARRIRAQPRYARLYLVAMTGYGTAEDLIATRTAGFDSHLVKPAEMEDLEALLARDIAVELG